MNDFDMEWLIGQLMGTAELLGQDIKPVVADMMASDLSNYPRAVLAAALSRVRTEHTGRLTIKAVIDRIDEAMGRPSANEAWSIALTALDESKTVVWTDEMAQAWGVANVIAQGGDLIGARMAFISAYERLVRTAREERRTPSVTVSEGWDANGRTQAVNKAVALGYMPLEQARQYQSLPNTAPGFEPVALLSGNFAIPSGVDGNLKEKIIAFKKKLLAMDAVDTHKGSARIQAEKRKTDELKAKAQKMFDDAMMQRDHEFRNQRAA